MLLLYEHHLSPTFQKAVVRIDQALLSDHHMLGCLDFWNYLSLAMTYHRAPFFPKRLLCFATQISRFCSTIPPGRVPFLDDVTRTCVTTLMEQINNIKNVLSPQIEPRLGVNLRDPSFRMLWDISQAHEFCLATMYQLGSHCCSRIEMSDDFYLQAKDAYDNDPFFMSNPFLDDREKGMLKAYQQQQTAAIELRNPDVNELIIHKIEELRKESFSAYSKVRGIDQVFQTIDTSNKFQYFRAYAQGAWSGPRESIETRFSDITQSHMDPVVSESTESIQERISKLNDLLSEDLPHLWRRNIHQTISQYHDRIGEYLLAYEHWRLQKDEEDKVEPEALAKIKSNEKATEKYWTSESTRPPNIQGNPEEVTKLIEHEKASLQTGMQTLSWDDPSMLSKPHRMGMLLNRSQKFSEAIPWLRLVIKGRKQAFGMDVEGVLEPTYELASALKWQFQLDEAIASLRPVVVQALGQENNRVLTNEYFVNAQLLLGRYFK